MNVPHAPGGQNDAGRIPGGARALPPAAGRLLSFLAFASRHSFEISGAQVESRLPALSNQPFSEPPAVCDHHTEALSLDPSPLLSPLSPGHLHGVAFHMVSSLAPAPRVQTRLSTPTDRNAPHPTVGPSSVLPNSAHPGPSPGSAVFHGDTERSPGGFFPKTY